MKRFLILSLLATAAPASAQFTSGASANLVLGQVDMNSSVSTYTATGMEAPFRVFIDSSGYAWVADTQDNRVLRFTPPFSNHMAASLVLGQSVFNSSTTGTTATTMNSPQSVAKDSSGNLWVSDSGNSRLLRFPIASQPVSNGMAADLVLGQANLTSGSTPGTPTQASLAAPQGIFADPSGNLWVADFSNSRVLEYVPPFSNGMNATLVLGQADFVTAAAQPVSASALNFPMGVWVDASTNVWVADATNNRVVRFPTAITNGASADLVLGQVDLNSNTPIFPVGPASLASPEGVFVDKSGSVWVADQVNNRVVHFPSPISNGETADVELGQPGPTFTIPGTSSSQMTQPSGVLLDAGGNVWIADQGNNRVIRFSSAPAPSAPGIAATPFTQVGVSSLTFNYTNGGNAGTLLYNAQLATDSGFTSPVSSLTYNTSATFTGLNPNVTYYAEVSIADDGNGQSSGPSAVKSTSTLAAGPTSLVSTLINITSTTLTWGANGNPAGTPFYLSYSPPGGSTTTVSAGTASPGTLTGLQPGTTYMIYVSAKNNNGVVTTGASTTTVTLSYTPQPPASAAQAFTSVTTSGLIYHWALGYTLGTATYEARISTDPAFSVFSSSITLNLNATFSPLLINATYYAKVRVSDDGFGATTAYAANASTSTLAVAPTGTAMTGVTTTSESLSWSPNGDPTGTQYEAQVATSANFGGVLVSSFTQNAAATIAGLTPNTTYFLRARAINWNGIDTTFDTTLSSATDATAPITPAATVTGSSQVNFTWAANGNPTGTVYLAQLATANTFAVIQTSSQTLNTSATFTGLNPQATFYLRVEALGFNGSPSAFTTTVSTVTGPLSAPSDAHLTAISNVSATAGWTLVPGATGYVMIASPLSANPPVTIQSSTTVGNTNSATTPNLLPDTTYFFFIGSLGPGIATPYVQFISSSTLPDAPGANTATGVTNTSLSFSWTLGNNHAGILYQAQASADSGFTSPLTSATYNTSASFTGLTVNTIYYLRVRAVNGGTPGAYNATISTGTDANAPVTPSAVGDSSSQITLSWGANSNPAGTLYTAQLSTASDLTGTITSRQVSVTNVSFTSLAAATTYYMRVKTNGFNGTDTAFSVITSTVTKAVPPDSLSGTVTLNGTGVNLIDVQIYNTAGTLENETHTDTNGAWIFHGLTTSASHKVVATYTLPDSAATSIFQDGHITGEAGIAMNVTGNVTLGTITGTLSLPAGAVRAAGRYATAATASGGAFVEVYQNGQKSGTVAADAQGRFTVPNLMPGHYALRSFDGAAYGDMTPVTVASGQSVSVAFVAELLNKDSVYFYPNPARDHAVIRFATGVTSVQAQASVFDITGALIRDFAGGDAAHSGSEVSWTWDLKNSKGQAVASGVYLVQVKVVDPATGRRAVVTKKLAVVR